MQQIMATIKQNKLFTTIARKAKIALENHNFHLNKLCLTFDVYIKYYSENKGYIKVISNTRVDTCNYINTTCKDFGRKLYKHLTC